MKRKVSLTIEGLGTLDGFWTPFEEIKDPVKEDESPIVEDEPIVVELPSLNQVIDISDSFIGSDLIELEPGKHYWGGYIKRQTLLNRNVKIFCKDKFNKPILEFGVENYDPLIHGNQDDCLFWMHDNSSLLIQNVDICQREQIKTVQTFNPKIVSSASVDLIKWTVVIDNCDTTRLGNNGGFGIGLIAGSKLDNHLALLNFNHWGVGLMDAKNPYLEGVMYVTMRNVKGYLGEDARISPTNFRHIGSLKNDIVTFDGTTFCLSAGYNFKWKDNFTYLMLWNRYTFFIDGYKDDTIQGPNKFKLRPQASGKIEVGVLSINEIYSNEFEMHSGDSFEYDGKVYRIISKDRISYPYYDSRTSQAIVEPDKVRAIVYKVDSNLPLFSGKIEIDYKGEKIEFKDQDITFTYIDNQNFRTDLNTTYRQDNLIRSRGIGHLFYNHSDISADWSNVEVLGPYRGSEAGKGNSLIWNLYNCKGIEDSPWFKSALEVTHKPDLPLHDRVVEVLFS